MLLPMFYCNLTDFGEGTSQSNSTLPSLRYFLLYMFLVGFIPPSHFESTAVIDKKFSFSSLTISFARFSCGNRFTAAFAGFSYSLTEIN